MKNTFRCQVLPLLSKGTAAHSILKHHSHVNIEVNGQLEQLLCVSNIAMDGFTVELVESPLPLIKTLRETLCFRN